MTHFLPFVLFVVGFVMIIKGSDWFIDAVVWIAKVSKIPDIIIGATLVSMCTTLPEAMVSAGSALKGNTDMAVGNALGSIACNTGLILAVTIIFARPVLQDRRKFQKKGILLVSLLIFVAVIGFIFGEVSRFTGIILLGILVWYLYNNVRESLQNGNVEDSEPVEINKGTVIRNILLFIVGLSFTIWGANLLVTNGEKIAAALGVPDIVIGLTMTAFGTSLPELMTAITAIRKKVHNISVGNILGANILNIILVTGLAATILPIPFNKSMVMFHFPFILLIVGSTVAFAFFNKTHFRRRNGFLLLCTYLVYVVLTVT